MLCGYRPVLRGIMRLIAAMGSEFGGGQKDFADPVNRTEAARHGHAALTGIAGDEHGVRCPPLVCKQIETSGESGQANQPQSCFSELATDAMVSSALMKSMAPDTLEAHIHARLDHAGLPHHTFTDDALHLVLRVSEGVLRAVKTSVSALIEAVRDRTKTVDLKQINAVLMQPHWRHNTRDEAQQPVVFTNQKPKN